MKEIIKIRAEINDSAREAQGRNKDSPTSAPNVKLYTVCIKSAEKAK